MQNFGLKFCDTTALQRSRVGPQLQLNFNFNLSALNVDVQGVEGATRPPRPHCQPERQWHDWRRWQGHCWQVAQKWHPLQIVGQLPGSAGCGAGHGLPPRVRLVVAALGLRNTASPVAGLVGCSVSLALVPIALALLRSRVLRRPPSPSCRGRPAPSPPVNAMSTNPVNSVAPQM